jgi:hypothetical protein
MLLNAGPTAAQPNDSLSGSEEMRRIVAFVLLNAAFGGTPTPKHQRSLSHIAVRLLRDVLKGDKDVLLRYEDTALQQKRREELRDPRNLLYCHVFDESCSDWKNGSVKKQMDKWKSPAYKVVYNSIDTAVVYHFRSLKMASDVWKHDTVHFSPYRNRGTVSKASGSQWSGIPDLLEYL